MLDTNTLIDLLVSRSYSHLCVVPCSFAKNIINAAINHNGIEYTPCASEAVACSVAAGLKMADRRPIVIVQSSGLTNMGSCITSLLKPYGVTFPMIVSWRTYKAGDSEIQHQHLATKLPDLIKAYGYDYTILDKNDIGKAIEQIDHADANSFICVLEANTFAKAELQKKHQLDLSNYTSRSEFLKQLNIAFKNSETLFIGTTGNTAREMYSFMPDTHNFYMAGNMGGALSLGLGAAKAGKHVIVCGGDAEFVMHMGGLSTAGRYADEIDLTYILFDNQSNKSTGGQNTYQRHIDYINIAKSTNFYTDQAAIKDVPAFVRAIKNNKNKTGLRFVYVKCGFDNESPRPPLDIVQANRV